MGLINPTLPEIGQARGTEEIDLRNALVEILALVNGNLDQANIAAGAVDAEVSNNSIKLEKLVAGADGLAKGAFCAYRSTAVSLGNGVQIIYNAEDFDVSGWFNTANARFTPQLAGIYRLSAFQFINAPTTFAWLAVRKNGVDHRYLPKNSRDDVSTNQIMTGGSCLVQANGTTDYFDVVLYHGSGATVVPIAVGGSRVNRFEGELVGKL